MVTIIIPCYNSGKTIEHILRRLEAQSKNNRISEIIIVDSSDDRETKPILSKYESGKIKVINAGARIMPAVSRNIGSMYASGVFLVFLDADVYPSYVFFERIIEAIDGGCRAGGGGIEIADFQKNSLLARAQFYLQFNEYTATGRKRKKYFIPTCNMFCDKELFERIGKFPEIRASEDVLFGLNMSKIADLWFIPEAKVYHIFRESWIAFIKNQILLGKYVCVYRKHYYKSFIYRGIMPVILLPIFLLVKLLRITGRVVRAGGIHILRFVTAFPVFCLGLVFWGIGFLEGCVQKG